MLLGSPPDMVHGAPPYRARPPAYPDIRISALPEFFAVSKSLTYYKRFEEDWQEVFLLVIFLKEKF